VVVVEGSVGGLLVVVGDGERAPLPPELHAATKSPAATSTAAHRSVRPIHPSLRPRSPDGTRRRLANIGTEVNSRPRWRAEPWAAEPGERRLVSSAWHVVIWPAARLRPDHGGHGDGPSRAHQRDRLGDLDGTNLARRGAGRSSLRAIGSSATAVGRRRGASTPRRRKHLRARAPRVGRRSDRWPVPVSAPSAGFEPATHGSGRA